MIDETDADIKTIVMAYVAVDECYGLKWLNDAIDALDTCTDGQVQLSLYASVQDLLLSRMVWYVRNVDLTVGLDSVIARFGPGIRQIAAGLDKTLPEDLQAGRSKRRQDLIDAGVPVELAGEDVLGVAGQVDDVLVRVAGRKRRAQPTALVPHFDVAAGPLNYLGVNPKVTGFEASCFSGTYITGDITSDYLRSIEVRRHAKRDSGEDEAPQLDLNLAA